MFPFIKEDQKKLEKWLAAHDEECRYADPKKRGAIGETLIYKFTPTSIGLITKVCCTCGAEIDLTDYKSW